MDRTTHALLEAAELVLNECQRPHLPGLRRRWSFEEDSEAHVVLVEAIEQARAGKITRAGDVIRPLRDRLLKGRRA